MTELAVSLLRVGGVLGIASAVGWLAAGALVPSGRVFSLERLAWGVAVGTGLLAASVPLSLLAGLRPGWIGFAILSAACLGVSFKFQVSSLKSSQLETWNLGLGTSPATAILALLILFGVCFYALQALTEPMWSNDFIAIWGLKGKVVFLAGGFPPWLRGGPGFAHPEYPLGLPLLYAGLSFLTGRWDDHAMALLFPLCQVATLGAAAGWLRRRGLPLTGTLLVTAILANFQPLYSAFLTGLADVPLALGLLLFGTALGDALDANAEGSLRRVALAAAILTATKNEGLYLAVVGCAVGLILGGKRRWKIAAAALPTALLVHLLHLLWRGRLPLRDFDFGLFSFARLGEALSAAAGQLSPAGWAGAVLVVALVLLGARRTDSGALLAIAAAALAAYLLLPVVAVRGPEWLVRTTLLRTTAALAPLVAAAVAIRYQTPRRA